MKEYCILASYRRYIILYVSALCGHHQVKYLHSPSALFAYIGQCLRLGEVYMLALTLTNNMYDLQL
jgi:hypothetical protein